MLFSCVWFFYGCLKTCEGACPHSIKVRAKARDALRIELVKTASTGTAIAYETGFLEHLEMLRDGRPRDRQRLREFVHRQRAAGKLLKDRHARRISKSIKARL
jgi:hypothetical protein